MCLQTLYEGLQDTPTQVNSVSRIFVKKGEVATTLNIKCQSAYPAYVGCCYVSTSVV